MAGSLDLVQRGFLGLEVGEEALYVNPPKLDPLKKITLRINYRRHWISISLDDKRLKITFEEGWRNKVKIGVMDEIHEFKLGEVREFRLP